MLDMYDYLKLYENFACSLDIDVMAMFFISNLKATNSMGFIWIWFI